MNGPVSLGLAVVVLVTGGLLAVIHRRRVVAAVRDFLGAAETHPVNLAVFRVVLFGLLAYLAWTGWVNGGPRAFGELPASLRFPPVGTRGIVGTGALDPLLTSDAIGVGLLVLALSSSAAAVGIATRASAAVAAVSALYVLGVPQLFGKVNHSHHLVWFAALLAASPSGDAFSVDVLVRRWSARRRGVDPPTPGPSRAYGLPLRVAWLLIGFLYLFPGLHKYASNGLRWALSDNLANRVLVHHAAAGVDVPGWIQAIEPLLPLLAGAAMALEIAFVVLLFSDRLRPWAVGAMLAFHVGTRFLLRIWFFHLVVLYVVFVDWHALGVRIRERWGGERAPTVSPAIGQPRVATYAVAAVLAVGAAVTGARAQVAGWPFASYPTFANIQQPFVDGVDIVATWEDGRPDRTVVLGDLVPWLEASRLQGLTASVLRAPDRDRRLAALWEIVERDTVLPDPDRIEELRFYRTRTDLRDPDAGRRELVLTLSPAS